MSEQDVREWTPRPDPTLLTTQQLLRELASLERVFGTRLDGMDKANSVLAETVNRTPTAIQTAIANLQAVYDERFNSVHQQSIDEGKNYEGQFNSIKQELENRGNTFDVRFSGIQQQFAERDVRTEQAATASASALAAALQAAKEAVFEQSQAAGRAAEKTELSFTKQIDQIGLRIDTVIKGYDDRLTELKERIDRGEGNSAGASTQRTETRSEHGESRLNMGFVISAVLAIFTIVTFILYVTKK